MTKTSQLNTICRILNLSLCAAMLSLAPAFAQTLPHPAVADAKIRAETKPIKASKIILIGDSTVSVHGGWGSSFCEHHVTSFLACLNLARGGRSSFSYRAEGSWAIALSEMKTQNYDKIYVLIQFGHNDQPGKPGRTTDLKDEYPAFLTAYIKDVRQAGAIPVLVTPLTRRMFKEGVLGNELEPWAEAVRKVAQTENVALIDLYARSQQIVSALGAAQATQFAPVPPSAQVMAAAQTGTTISAKTGVPAPTANEVAVTNPATAALQPTETASLPPLGFAKVEFDYTHLGRSGADFFAKIVTEELSIKVPELRPLLVP